MSLLRPEERLQNNNHPWNIHPKSVSLLEKDALMKLMMTTMALPQKTADRH
ncbi:MAG: hypothetical protein MI861_26635 [Pirellulales bacterium]|nr:hypothetical protein [Pirellulales bacterium]